MRRAAAMLAVLVAVPALSGCASCDPETVPAELTLTLDDEEVRTLPMLRSGGTEIAGVDVPDSHGRLAVDVGITHNISSAEVEDLRLDVSVGGEEIPVEIHHIEGGSEWEASDSDRTWDGEVRNDTELVLWWAVDDDRASPADLVLDGNASYTATVEATWHHESCSVKASGTIDTTFDGFVQEPVDAQTFETEDARFERTGTGGGFRANYTIRSGQTVTIQDVSAVAAVAGASGPAGGIGVVTFPAVGWNVSDEDRDTVTPVDVLHVHSAADPTAGAEYEASGIAAPATTDMDTGLVVLSVEIRYEPDDPSVGPERDTFAYGFVP